MEFKKQPPDREPTPADRLFVMAEYKRTGSIKTAASRANLEQQVTANIVQQEIERNPSILRDPGLLLSIGLSVREIANDAAIVAGEKLRDPRIRANDAMYTHKLAAERSKTYLDEWMALQGEAASVDEDELDKAIRAKEEELARIAGQGDDTPGCAADEGSASPDGVSEGMEPDSETR